MVKKRRQSDPHANASDSSSDDNEKNDSSRQSSCPHLKKSVDVQRLRKAFKASPIENDKCVECAKLPNGGISALEASEFDYDRTLWMCLKCGTNLCGRSINRHALDHYITPRSDSHSLAVNTTTLEVWCYQCDSNVDGSDSKLAQCIDFIKKEINRASNTAAYVASHTASNTTSVAKAEIVNGDVCVENVEGVQINVEAMRSMIGNTIRVVHSLSPNSSIPGQARRVMSQQTANVDQLPRVRGLSNLGNTCFFNAVMQCLAQTPFLLSVLNELSEPNEEFSLPGGSLKLKDNEEEVELESISGKLSSWGSLTAALAETLEELQKSGGVYNPRKLFSSLTKVWPQFDGGDQHDSHELLRHLLESVKTEDLNRYKKVILSHLQYYKEYRGKDLQMVPEDIKQKCKFYGQQASERILCPEQVFRGFLVSTLTCQDCHHTSSRHESFLDLSLPVNVEKPAPPIRRKSSPEEMSPNKENALKLKLQKQNEQRIRKNNRSSSSSSSSQEESDADVEDNLSEDVNSKKAIKKKAVDSNGNVESIVVKNEKQDDGPENSSKDLNDLKLTHNELLELGISAKGGQELAKQISQENDDDSAIQSSSLLDSFHQLKLNDHKVKKMMTKRKRLYSYTDWSSTFGERYQCEDGECSVQSCLSNFTALELMTGNNKVGCDSCSERINGKDGKTINTNATKQFFISSPPAVLILHLKRFQVGPRCMFRKMTKHVTFPFTLDLAPFCASKVKTLPNVHRHQKKLIYSLYGIVEHSGSMHGGHYVAYVKVRPNLAPDDPRWKFLPKGSKVELDQTDEQKVRLDEALKKNQIKENRLKSGDSDDSTSSSSSDAAANNSKKIDPEATNSTEPPIIPATPTGKWYYVSDSHVQEATEDRVSKAQAYLLFYERIY